MAELSQRAHAAYRGLVRDDPGFLPFFRQFTPIDELSLLELGSRPPRRPGGRGGLDSLRAIPWVFAWTQTRCLVPAWYGLGAALAPALQDAAGRRELRALYGDWPFFRALIENAEMALAKSSPEIARLYLDLVPASPDRDRLWRLLDDEHAAAVAGVLEVVEAGRLLDRHAVVQRAIELRNPYVDPINAVQVELLRRFRSPDTSEAERAALRRPLARSVAGVAAGLRNTG
jgi:phosphoenolpyruvate carboxylase